MNIGLSFQQFKAETHKALRDPVLRKAIADLQDTLSGNILRARQQLTGAEELRRKAREIREQTLAQLDRVMAELTNQVEKNRGRVYFAADARDANDYCLAVARQHGVRLVVKGKSMLSEEIDLNRVLEEQGIEVCETDIGELIVQWAGEKPSHILAPAAHKTRAEIGRLFSEKLGVPYTDSPRELTELARQALRQKFLQADMGITGCNLAIAETGHITLLSNEGNIRLATTLPKIHIALMGLERVVATLEEHEVLMQLLPRSASGQKLPVYVSYTGGAPDPGGLDGPEEFHLVIVDNGRSKILGDPDFREILYCLHCGACMNVCPVYRQIGGHPYGSPYPGPLGAVLTPLLYGPDQAADLCFGETLCGACRTICPVQIDFTRLLLLLRVKIVNGDPYWGVRGRGFSEKIFYKAWSWLIQGRQRYERFLKVASRVQSLLPRRNHQITRLPWPFSGWTKGRDLRPLAKAGFLAQQRKKH